MDIEQARFNMIEQQIRTWEVLDQSVLDLLYVVRREEFVPEAYRALAFSDLEIPLSKNGADDEKMLQPKVEARILQEVAPHPTDRVLEVGSGSGYLTALLASRAQQLYGVEISPALQSMAEANLRRAGIQNASVELGDAAYGWAQHMPYDVIILGASTPELPDTLLDQLNVGGRLFAVIGEAPVMQARLYTRVTKASINAVVLFETCIAPLKNAAQREQFKF